MSVRFLANPPRCELHATVSIAAATTVTLTWDTSTLDFDPSNPTTAVWLPSPSTTITVPTAGRYAWSMQYEVLWSSTPSPSRGAFARALSQPSGTSIGFYRAGPYPVVSGPTGVASCMSGQTYLDPTGVSADSGISLLSRNEATALALNGDVYLQMCWIAED